MLMLGIIIETNTDVGCRNLWFVQQELTFLFELKKCHISVVFLMCESAIKTNIYIKIQMR